MKNPINLNYFILPTKERTILCFSPRYNNGKQLMRFGEFENSYENECKFQFLYLTSEEEIKEGDWCYFGHSKEIGKFTVKDTMPSNCFKIEFTNDPKLHSKLHNLPTKYHSTTNFVDGIPALPEKTRIHVTFSDGTGDNVDVNFLTEFVNRYNQKQSAHIKEVDLDIIFPDKNEIDKYLGNSIDEWQKSLIRSFYNWIRPKIKINQSLKSNIGYSLEDMKKAYTQGGSDKYYYFDKFIQSLSKSVQDERKIQIQLIDGNIHFKD